LSWLFVVTIDNMVFCREPHKKLTAKRLAHGLSGRWLYRVISFLQKWKILYKETDQFWTW
jgi:hypothetical protein